MRDCNVCECPEHEFPESFKTPSLNVLPKDDPVCQEGKPEATVDRTLDDKSFKGWVEVDNPWTHDDETDNGNNSNYLTLRILELTFIDFFFKIYRRNDVCESAIKSRTSYWIHGSIS